MSRPVDAVHTEYECYGSQSINPVVTIHSLVEMSRVLANLIRSRLRPLQGAIGSGSLQA